MSTISVSFKLNDDWVSNSKKIEDVVSSYGGRCWASGAGFGYRDMDFDFDSLIDTYAVMARILSLGIPELEVCCG